MTKTDSTARRSHGTGTLYTRRGADGRDVYYGRGHVDGKRFNRKLGPVRDRKGSGLTKTQAEAKLASLLGSATCNPTVARSSPSARPTVAQVADAYVRHARFKGRKPSTVENLDSELRTHIVPALGDKPVDAVTAHDVADFVAALHALGLAPKTIRNIVATLSALFNFARAPLRGWVKANPCDGVELPAVPESVEIRFLTLDEVEKLIAAAQPGLFAEIDPVMYRAAAMTGLRRGELLGLRWGDIDWLGSRIRVAQSIVRGRTGTPKSRKARSVPMALEVARDLERLFQGSRYQADGDLVFAHPLHGGSLYPAGILRRMRRSLAAAGLDQRHTFHELRHTFATHLAAAGAPIARLQDWLGHEDPKTTEIYRHYMPGADEAALIASAFSVERRLPVA